MDRILKVGSVAVCALTLAVACDTGNEPATRLDIETPVVSPETNETVDRVEAPEPKTPAETTAAGPTTDKKVTGGADDMYKPPMDDQTQSPNSLGTGKQPKE